MGILKVFSIPSVYLMNRKIRTFWWMKSHCMYIAHRQGACSCSAGVGWWGGEHRLLRWPLQGRFLNHLPHLGFSFLPERSIFTIPSFSLSSLPLPFPPLFPFHQPEQELNKTSDHKFAISRKTQTPEMSCVCPNPF